MGVNSRGVVCLSPAIRLLSPPVLPVSVSVSASDPVSLITSAEKGGKKTQKKNGGRKGGRGVEVLAEMVLRGGEEKRRKENRREEKRREEKRSQVCMYHQPTYCKQLAL